MKNKIQNNEDVKPLLYSLFAFNKHETNSSGVIIFYGKEVSFTGDMDSIIDIRGLIETEVIKSCYIHKMNLSDFHKFQISLKYDFDGENILLIN